MEGRVNPNNPQFNPPQTSDTGFRTPDAVPRIQTGDANVYPVGQAPRGIVSPLQYVPPVNQPFPHTGAFATSQNLLVHPLMHLLSRFLGSPPSGAAQQQPQPMNLPTKPNSVPDEDTWVKHMTTQTPSQAEDYFRQLYRRAVHAPGGQYYNQPTPTQSPIQPIPVDNKSLRNNIQPIPVDNKSLFPNFTTTPVPLNLSDLVYRSAKNAGVDPNVFASLLFSEHGFQTSEGRNYNTDGSYDRGIAQINNKYHPDITDAQALDPNFAVPWAANLLASHVKKFNGDYNRGIAAYNVGEGGAGVTGTTVSGLGVKGQTYLDKVARGLTPQLIKQLGIKASQ